MSAAPAMPAIFFGHGSPMIALETNATTAAWQRIGAGFARPKAIVCVSAHWCTRGTAVTAMPQPRTIHDFGAFPQALFDVQYPAPGSPELAARVQALLAPLPVALDERSWGFDHGTWSVLCKVYPDADVPVVQLSMDISQPPTVHYEIGRRLAPLRDEGVLIVGTGNVVHNLGLMNWDPATPPYDWAQRFHDYVRDALADDAPQRLVDYRERGRDAQLSVPSPDHYWPLLYAAGARRSGDRARFEVERVEHGSLSMLSVVFEPDAA
ncbi:MAG: 4,5-DOPA dioxygenase extradiol [Solimonas sp.]